MHFKRAFKIHKILDLSHSLNYTGFSIYVFIYRHLCNLLCWNTYLCIYVTFLKVRYTSRWNVWYYFLEELQVLSADVLLLFLHSHDSCNTDLAKNNPFWQGRWNGFCLGVVRILWTGRGRHKSPNLLFKSPILGGVRPPQTPPGPPPPDIFHTFF